MFLVFGGVFVPMFILQQCWQERLEINVKRMQFIHTVNGRRSKTVKIIKRQY